MHSSLSDAPPAEQAAAAADAMYAFAYAMTEQDRWRDASDVFRAMLLFVPTDERGWLGLGRCHDALGEAGVATELYSLCLLALPRAVRARVALARLLRDASREDDAEHVLDAAADIAAALDDQDLVSLVSTAKRQA